ncbi:MAG: hypothetical protein FJ358_07260 [Thaumarchaeota archaeon]|nr:hypothetical protein [Nitrososphaerota archaeon]
MFSAKRTHELVEYRAEPSDQGDTCSTWAIFHGKRSLTAFGKFDYNVRAGVYFGLKDALFDLSIVIDKGELIQIKNAQGKAKDIEKGRVFPLIMSRHAHRWKMRGTGDNRYTYCILPQSNPTEKNEEEMKLNYPRTWSWLNDFRKEFLQRKSKVFAKDPFYSVYGLGDWDSKYKVVWQGMGFYPDFSVISSVEDKILGKKLVLPEHVLYFIPIDKEDEAHYVCAILNSSLVKDTLFTLTGGGKSGISKEILTKLRLDKFDHNNRIHNDLAQISKKAHKIAESNNEDEITGIQADIDDLVNQAYATKPYTLSQ